jgi:nondiscriminating aspartyl-tRNA synthetase
MERTSTTGLAAKVGERVRIAGWLHAYRRLGGIGFAVVRDAHGLAQVVLDQQLDLFPESVVDVEGVVVRAEEAPGGVELHEPAVTVVSPTSEPPPVELRRAELKEKLPTLLDHAAVSLRHPRVRDRFRLAAAATAGFRCALDALGFVEINTPKVVASATEGGANVFSLDWFGRAAFLAQSPQFYKQTMVGVFERVYEVGPVFRAEPHDTARHLAEYVSLDAELGFIEDHRDVMRVVREAVAGMLATIGERCGVDVPEVPPEIPVLHLAETGVDDVDLSRAPHGGFALGLERFVARLVGAVNIRETTLFPRDLTRLTP